MTYSCGTHHTLIIILSAFPSSFPPSVSQIAEHTFLFYGAGEAGVGIGMMISEAVAIQTGCSIAAGSDKIWFVDSKGLVSNSGTFNLFPSFCSFSSCLQVNLLFFISVFLFLRSAYLSYPLFSLTFLLFHHLSILHPSLSVDHQRQRRARPPQTTLRTRPPSRPQRLV